MPISSYSRHLSVSLFLVAMVAVPDLYTSGIVTYSQGDVWFFLEEIPTGTVAALFFGGGSNRCDSSFSFVPTSYSYVLLRSDVLPSSSYLLVTMAVSADHCDGGISSS